MGEYIKGVGYKGHTDREVRMAAAIQALVAQGKLTLDETLTQKYGSLENDLHDIRMSQGSLTAQYNRIHQNALDKAAAKQAVLDADVKILVRGPKCQATVQPRGRVFSSHVSHCDKFATVERTWTTYETKATPIGHEADTIFCTCEPGEHDDYTRERVAVEHSMVLCGTHKQVSGQYGFPWS